MSKDDRRNTDREDYYDDYWGTPDPAPRRMSEAERERYYAQKDAYYASRDAYYASRDAYYASVEEDEDEDAADWEYEEEEYDAPAPRSPRRRKERRRRRRRRKGRFFRRLVLLAVLVGIGALLLGKPPVNNPSGKPRQSGRSTVLLAGTDPRGGPDTIMLLSLERGGRGVHLVSIPPDTCAEDGTSPWGRGARGGDMDALMAAARELLGFLPDAWVTLDMDAVAGAADLLGGLDFNVPAGVSYEDEARNETVELPAGQRHLDGAQLVDLARWYTGAGREDAGAMDVQSALLSAAREQWLRPANLRRLPDLWWELSGGAKTNLTASNLLWAARVLLKTDPASVSLEVLPCRAVMSDGEIVYMVDRPAANAILIDCDPYR